MPKMSCTIVVCCRFFTEAMELSETITHESSQNETTPNPEGIDVTESTTGET
jgi:hypothetical protein